MRKHVPKPAANRLFVAPREAAGVAISLTRAFIRCTLDLAENHLDDPAWARWYEEFFENLWFSDWYVHAVRPEYSRIEQRFSFIVQDGDEQIRMTRDELLTTFGRYVPTDRESGKYVPQSDINRVLLSKYAELDRDGKIVYDLETEAELPPID